MYSFQGLLSAQINALILFMELGVLISGVHFRGVLEREREIGGRIFGCDYEDTKTSTNKQALHSIVGSCSILSQTERRTFKVNVQRLEMSVKVVG